MRPFLRSTRGTVIEATDIRPRPRPKFLLALLAQE